jgi:hypothetical protein
MTVVLAVLVTALLSTAVQATPSVGRSDPAGSGSASNSVFTSDPSQDLVIDRATGLLPLISAASDVLPLASNGIAVAERRLRTMVDLLVSARQRHRSAVRAFAAANRLVADNVRDAAQLQLGYGDVLAGISTTQRARLERDARGRRNRSSVVRQATSSDWVCPIGGRVKFRDSWGDRRSGNRRHEGVDLVGLRNVPILAPVDGVVTHRWDTIGGWSFDLEAEDGDYYFGTHMSGFGKAGEVRAGEVIGSMGDTGNAQGVHLHLEYHPGGRNNAVNPYPIVDARCTDRTPMGTSLYD